MVEEPGARISYHAGSDTNSLVQLLQSDPTPRNPKKWNKLSGTMIALAILYAIVGTLILHLSISSSLREAFLKTEIKSMRSNDASNIPEDSSSIKKLEEDIANLQFQVEALSRKTTAIQKELSEWNPLELKENTSVPILEKNGLTTRISSLNTTILDLEAKMDGCQSQIERRVQEMVLKQVSSLNKSLEESISQHQMHESKASIHFEEEGKNQSNILQNTNSFNRMNLSLALQSLFNYFLKDIRSCQDYKRLGISENGLFPINLDSDLNTLTKVQVYCNFSDDSTLLYHNAGQEASNITACSAESCYEYKLSYNASLSVIRNLIDESDHCEQSITFRCRHAHLENHGYWFDSNGEKQVYFTGSNWGEHICSCSLKPEGCSGLPSTNKCNCDASLISSWLKDKGSITNSSALPITKFVYGYLLSSKDHGASIQIGPLKCKGRKKVNPDEECNEYQGYKLFKAGNTFYASLCDKQGRKGKAQLLIEDKPSYSIVNKNVNNKGFGTSNTNLLFPRTGYYITRCISSGYSYNSKDCSSSGKFKIEYHEAGELLYLPKKTTTYEIFLIS